MRPAVDPTGSPLRLALASLIGAAAFILAASPAAGQSAATVDTPSAVSAAVPGPQAEDLTLSLLSARDHWASAAPADSVGRLRALVSAAQRRYYAMTALVDVDPAAVLRAALPAGIRATFPADVASLFEADAAVDGSLAVYHVDGLDPAQTQFLYFLDTTSGRLSLHFADKPPELWTGTRVHVTGLRIGNAIVAESGGAVVRTSAAVGRMAASAATLPNTLGAQRTLMIYVNFIDNATQPFTIAQAQSMFTTVNNYWYEVSYQQTWLTGDVAGWFTIPLSSGTCDYNSLATYAKQAATNAGYVLTNYDHYVYVFPTWSACSWSGLGQIGGSPTEAWINPQAGLLASSFVHEMGHNLGLYHAHSLSCTGGVPIAASGCTKVEYGDGFDTMAAPQQTPHYNAFMKELLGWLNAGVSPPLITVPAVSGSANYTIAPLEVGKNTTPRALKIPRTAACGSATDYFYVESRQAIGFDSYIASLTTVPYGSTISPATNLQTGVLIHDAIPGGPGTAGSLNSSELLDMAASTTGWAGPALDAGLSFTDPVSGLTITPVSVGNSSSTITVSYPPASCTRFAPTVSFTPTGTQYTSAGTTETYAVTVTNNDSCSCAASAFNVAASVPAGWSANSPQIASIAPGASASTSLGITSSSTAAAAYYTIPIAATNAVVTTSTSSTSATIAITAPPTAPTVALSPPGTQSMTAGATLTYSVTVTNNGSSATSFGISAVVPTGWSATTPTTASIAAGASASVSLAVTASSTASAGTYTIPVTALDTADPGTTATVNASVSIATASLGVTVTSNQAAYSRPAKRSSAVYATIGTTVKKAGVAVAGAAVSVQVRDPGGRVTTLSGTTDANGVATVSYSITSRSKTGTYAVTSTASSGSTTGTATTSFTVQ